MDTIAIEPTIQRRKGAAVPHDPNRTRRLVTHVPLDLWEEVSAYQRRHRIMQTSEVVRRLLVAGLQAEAEEASPPPAPAAPPLRVRRRRK